MAYTPPTVGEVLPAKQNTDVTNPGPVHDPYGNTEWLQAQAQDKAFQNNQILIQEWENQKSRSPGYAQELFKKPTWAVLVEEAEAGGLDFQQQRMGPPLSTLVAAPKS